MLLHVMLGPLLLSSALLGLSTAQCPPVLHPPEIVRKLGEAADVNCTATDVGYLGIYWTFGGKKQDENHGSSVLAIPNIDWNSEANCTVKVNATHECSERLGIKVYKRPTNITVQSNAAAIDGHHLELKCDVHDVAIAQNLTVTWYMNNTTEKTEHYSPTNTMTNVTSVLLWAVSREHDGATFTCKASEVGPHGPLYVSRDSWKLSVQYAPKFEENKYNIHMNNSDDVILRCEAMGNPPPRYSWIKDGAAVENNTEYLNISRSKVNENMTFVCMASNDHGSDMKTFTVSVMESTPAAPKSSACPLTITPNVIVVKFGDPTSANCSTTETDADGIGWEASTGGTGLIDKTHLEWRVNKMEDWNIKPKCFISTQHRPQCMTPLSITVWKSPDKVQLSLNGTSSVVEGQPQQLKCDVFNVAPAKKVQVNWYQDGKLFHTDKDKFNESTTTPKNVSLILELTPKKEHNGVNFTCEAELLLGQEQNPKTVSEPYTADIQYKPILSCVKNQAGREDVFHLDAVQCEAKGNPEPTLQWYFNEKPVNSTKPLTRTESGRYTAKLINIIGETSTTVDITMEYAPSFSCKDHYNVTEDVDRRAECEPEGKPKPTVVWFKDGAKVESPKMWKRQDSGPYTLVASNKHGEANHTLHINVLYIHKFSEGATTREINVGENLTLECNADGNPPPQLHWKYPSAANVNTRGQQRNILVVEATSSNVGLYSCTATNEVGSVSKNVTLMIITGKSRNINNIIIIVAVLLFLLILIVGVLLYRNFKKKSGHYDIVRPSESVMPLNDMS